MKNNFKFSISTKNISDNEFEIIKENYFIEIKNLYDIMPNLTYEEYRKQFSEISDRLHDSGQHIFLPNTTWIENREFEVFGKHWYDDISI